MPQCSIVSMIQIFLASDYQVIDCLASDINDDAVSKEAEQLMKPR